MRIPFNLPRQREYPEKKLKMYVPFHVFLADALAPPMSLLPATHPYWRQGKRGNREDGK